MSNVGMKKVKPAGKSIPAAQKKPKSKKIIYEDKLEQLDFPGKSYSGEVVRDAVVAFMRQNNCFGFDNIDDQRDMVASFFTLLEDASDTRQQEKYERKRELRQKKKQLEQNGEDTDEITLTANNFDEKIVWNLFKSSDGICKYLRVKIAPSTIKAAGMGAYSVDPIPKGATCTYRGEEKSMADCVSTYSWEIKPYYEKSGSSTEGKPVCFLDASDASQSNATRYYNCGSKNKYNNFEIEQKFRTINYIALKDIPPDTELFCDYGEDYRKTNLGMKGPY